MVEKVENSVVVAGSFRTRWPEIQEVIRQFQRIDVQVLAPNPDGRPITDGPFVVFDTDTTTDARTLERGFLELVGRAKALFVYNRDGRIGRSVFGELHVAFAYGTRIFLAEPYGGSLDPEEETEMRMFLRDIGAIVTAPERVKMWLDRGGRTREQPAVSVFQPQRTAPPLETPSASRPSIPREAIQPRPRATSGSTVRIGTPVGTMFMTINTNSSGEPFEVFINVGKGGSDTTAVCEAMGRLISLTLRMPSSMEPAERLREIMGQLQGIGGGRHWGYGYRIRSLPDAIAAALWQYLGLDADEGTAPPLLPMGLGIIGDLCPDCGQATLIVEEGAQKCYSCGYAEA
ncbi:MAG: hypothetical protein Q8R13_01895 [bacterium]|nr:hypothetical protein [bacterium]MDZ4296211.1 hypothetical protein [Patescibacteria group bacterium]